MIKHFFNFITSGHGLREIEEPFGFKSAEFTIEQNDYYGRDINFAATKNRLTINRVANHCFNEMMYNLDHFGYEAVIEYMIEVNGNTYKFQVELLEHKTDGFNTVEFSLTELGKRALLRKRSDVKSDLMSGKDLDGNVIGQVPYTMALFKAKPVIGVSKWTTPVDDNLVASVVGLTGEGGYVVKYFNFANAQIKYDIEDSLSYIQGVRPPRFFGYIEFKENAQDITIRLSNLNVQLNGQGNGFGTFGLLYYIGEDEDLTGSNPVALGTDFFFIDVLDNEFEEIANGEYEAFIPTAQRGQKLYIYFTTQAIVDSNLDTFTLSATIDSLDVEITSTSIAYNTVVPFIRLIDAIRYVVKSSAGLDVYAPRFDVGGELYNQYITTSSLMRLLYDKPLNLSLKDIVEGIINEFNAGYSINSDDIVVFQLYKDYYRDYSLGTFKQAPTSQYDTGYNDNYKINQFTFKYSDYASQSEGEKKNSFDVVNGETSWINGNKATMNTKEVNPKSIRDAFKLEDMRRKSYDYSETSATSDDDKIGIVELVELTDENRNYTETSDLRHTVNDDNELLTLFNNGSFSWVQLGIGIGDSFEIIAGANVGLWIVLIVDQANITLISQTGATPVSNPEVPTTYNYNISNLVTLKVRTSEGFAYIGNIQEGYNFTNLAYTPKRNMINFWQEWLATSILYSKTIPYRNTVYKNNPEAITQLIGRPKIIEGADFLPTGAILDTIQDEVELEMDFEEYMAISKGAQDENGWIGFYNEWGLLIKIHPRTATWQMQGMDSEGGYYGIGKITGERRYEPFLISIFGTGNGTIIVNGGEIGANDFKYEVDEYGKLTIFDEVGEALYPPVPYDRVRINNGGNNQRIQQAKTPEQLLKWLKTLK